MERQLASSRKASKRLVDWTLAWRLIEGHPFSFKNHEYLIGLYEDESPTVVVRKAAQMGASEYAISRAMHFSITHGGRTMYFFPTDNDVGEFSRDRFAPAVESSEYFTRLVRDTDTAGLKQIGYGSIYFRGTRSRTRMKSVPGDFLVFDEMDEMIPANVELARKRLGHSAWGWELDLSTPSMPGYGIDAEFQKSDQRHWIFKCPACSRDHCLEDEFLELHGDHQQVRFEIDFIKGPDLAEYLVCIHCGHKLDPANGRWVAKYPDVKTHGYHLSKLAASLVSQQEKAQGIQTKPAALLRQWRETDYPGEFYNSELGLPYLAAEGGLTEQDLQEIEGKYGQMNIGKGCVMGVDQGNGLHIVVKEPTSREGMALTIRTHYINQTDESFSHLDRFMNDYDVRVCICDALPNTHAARSFAKRFEGRVWLAYYGDTQKGKVKYGYDKERSPIVMVNRTDAFDSWRDAHKTGQRRIPRIEDETRDYVKQMTNILRKIEEDSVTGGKRAIWVKRGPDHFAHADSYAELAYSRLDMGIVRASVVG